MRAKLSLLGAFIICLALATLAQGAEITQKGSLRVSFDGKLTPRALPRSGSAPVRVAVGAKIATTDGATPPQLRRITIAINRNGRFDPRGLPVCSLREVQPTTTVDALAACRGALVGEGYFTAKVLLKGQAPFPSAGKVYAFNSVLHGRPAILAHVYGTQPAPASFTIPFELQAAKGTFGTVLRASLPQVTGRLRLHHRPAADPRPQLLRSRQAAQLPLGGMPRASRLPRRRLPLRQGQLRLRQSDPLFNSDPQLQGAGVVPPPRPARR